MSSHILLFHLHMLTIAATLRNNSTQKSQLPYGMSDAAIWIKDPVASTSFFLLTGQENNFSTFQGIFSGLFSSNL